MSVREASPSNRLNWIFDGRRTANAVDGRLNEIRVQLVTRGENLKINYRDATVADEFSPLLPKETHANER